MKKYSLFFIGFLFFLTSIAQRIQTIVPKQPVVVGNAFQVQYIITEPSDLVKITEPSFDGLRLISGPNYYKGNSVIGGKMQSIQNITYTVVPLKTGKININGMASVFKQGDDKSSNATITVIPQPGTSYNSSSSYTDVSLYAPSSKADLNKLIEENLFVNAEVDRKACFLGEPVIVSFKLYSRLQSVSEVINAPSLYGFSVMDMLSINEAHQSVETINGKVFNTSILRKLQLYPVQIGKLVIDPIQLNNEVEFRDSLSVEKIKIKKLLASNPVEITVKPLPGVQPQNYSGAVGQFTITGQLQNHKIDMGQQGRLTVRISGKGNFIQFSEPVIRWPQGFDVFDAEVVDHLDRNSVPAKGSKEYVFNFTSDNIGNFTISPVSFSYFDPAKRMYRTVSSDSLSLEIVPVSKTSKRSEVKNSVRTAKSLWIIFAVIALVLVLLLALRFRTKFEKPAQAIGPLKPDHIGNFHEVNTSGLKGKQFYVAIQKLLSEVNKTGSLTQLQKNELASIQNECQLLIYSDINSEGQEDQLKKRILGLLRQLK